MPHVQLTIKAFFDFVGIVACCALLRYKNQQYIYF
nr:MAG TPA: hypothetical protein [Caudoviricetes sp.]DAG41797.1 MAG TPA: hypothetical protein [Caudoviricetes sp.]DAJ58580.1 MAG TPA: hypothetical protein [Caudoviricetes sp.]